MQPYEALEKALGKWCGYETAVCSTGTAALHLALEAVYTDPPADAPSRTPRRVLVPDYQFVAVARAVSMRGLRPHFVDVDPTTHNVDVEKLGQAAKREDVVGILAVSSFGRRAPMHNIIEIARENDLFVIEDLAEAHGVRPHPLSDAVCWSFFRNKIVHAEEGGAVASRMPEVVDKVRCLRSQGYRPGRFWDHEPRGVNARMTNAQAALILDSLWKIDANLEQRAHIAGLHDTLCPMAWKLPVRNVNWLYDFRIPGLKVEQQQAIVQSVNQAGIYCRPGFSPLSLMDEYRGSYGDVSGIQESVSEVLEREVVALDCSPITMSQRAVEDAWDVIRRSFT